MRTTVIIPNYNGIKYIDNCIKSLYKQTYLEFDIIVVDNNSNDGSKELILSNHPKVNLISLEENYGFSKAVNIGIKKSSSDYVILLNNDTEADENFVEELVKAIEKSDKIFSVSSKMLSYYNREIIDDAGDYYTILGWAFARGKNQSKSGYNKSTKVFSSCAGAAIYRKHIFNEIGFFDELHFAYLEDIDIGYRARIAGYNNWYEPKAQVYHIGSGTSGSKYNHLKIRLAARNSLYLIYKNMPVIQLILNFIPLLIGYLLKTMFFIFKGYGILYVKSVFEGLKSVNKCKKVKFNIKNVINYFIIEYELTINLFKILFSRLVK